MNYYDFALKNLKTAELHFNYEGDMDEVVIACHQYFEKSFKQLLIVRDGSVYKTHKLSFLVRKLNVVEFSMHEDLFRIIEDYYFDKRYPSEVYEETTLEEASTVYNLVLNLKPVIEDYLDRFKRDANTNRVKRSTTFGEI